MSKTKTIKLMNIETLNIAAWYKDFSEKKKNKELPVRVQFDLQRNVTKLTEAAQNLEKFRNELLQDIQDEYFKNDEKSYDADIEKTEGNKVTEKGRKVKEEFIAEYQGKLSDADEKYREIAIDTDEYLIKVFDLDAFVDGLADDTKLELDDLNMLSFMDANREENEEE